MKRMSLIESVQEALNYAQDRISKKQSFRRVHVIQCYDDTYLYYNKYCNIRDLSAREIIHHQGTIYGNILAFDFFYNPQLKENFDLYQLEIMNAVNQFEMVNYSIIEDRVTAYLGIFKNQL